MVFYKHEARTILLLHEGRLHSYHTPYTSCDCTTDYQYSRKTTPVFMRGRLCVPQLAAPAPAEEATPLGRTAERSSRGGLAGRSAPCMAPSSVLIEQPPTPTPGPSLCCGSSALSSWSFTSPAKASFCSCSCSSSSSRSKLTACMRTLASGRELCHTRVFVGSGGYATIGDEGPMQCMHSAVE